MAGPIVGSEGDSIECWENYSAGEVLVQGLAGQIHQQDVEAIVRAQKQMLQRFEKTNEMLSNCNALSASRYASAHQEFGKHSSMLLQAKKDLDYIFKKIRTMKSKLETQYPHAVAAVAEKFREEDEDDEETVRPDGVESVPPTTQQLLLRGAVSGGEGSSASGESSSGGAGGNTTKTSSVASGSSGAAQAGDAVRRGGEEQVPGEEADLLDRDDEQAILSGKAKRVSGKLHHISSSDSSTSSSKSTSSSIDS